MSYVCGEAVCSSSKFSLSTNMFSLSTCHKSSGLPKIHLSGILKRSILPTVYNQGIFRIIRNSSCSQMFICKKSPALENVKLQDLCVVLYRVNLCIFH